MLQAANALSAGATDRYHQGHTGDDRWNAAYAFASAGYRLGYNMGDAAAEYDITVLGNRDQGVSSGVYTGRIEDGMIRCTNDLITAMKYLTEEEHPDGIPDDMQTFLDGLNDLDSVADYYAYLNSSEDFQTLDRDIWIQSGAEAGSGMNVSIDVMNASVLGIEHINVSTIEGAKEALAKIPNALNRLSSSRSKNRSTTKSPGTYH